MATLQSSCFTLSLLLLFLLYYYYHHCNCLLIPYDLSNFEVNNAATSINASRLVGLCAHHINHNHDTSAVTWICYDSQAVVVPITLLTSR